MPTETTEIADGVHRISTYVEPPGLVFNQFLLTADEPLLFHTGMRGLFPEVSAAVQRIVPLSRLRWVAFGHLEADECGSMNEWLHAAPSSQIAHGTLGCRLSINDMADRPPRQLAHDEVVDLGGKRVRRIETPHVPHGWDAGLLFEEVTGTLFCGDLFTALGRTTALTEADIVGPALSAEDNFGATCLTPTTAPTIRSLANLQPTTLGLMHGPAHTGDCEQALNDLAHSFDERLRTAGVRMAEPRLPGE